MVLASSGQNDMEVSGLDTFSNSPGRRRHPRLRSMVQVRGIDGKWIYADHRKDEYS
jgi:hypothetical protein